MIKNQALGGRSNKALIFLGLFLGLVSALLVVVYLSQASGGDGAKTSEAVTPVVVASQDISPGTRLTQEMLTVKPIPTSAVLSGAFKEVEGVVGQVTRVPLVAGEQVIPTKVTATGTAITNVDNPPLALVIPEGQRAISIPVSQVIGASGLIRPGDYVDVILTIEVQESIEGETSKDQIARTILQNAQVLSVDQEVALTSFEEGAQGSPSISEEADANPLATTVTLAVSPAHAEVLTVAELCGQNSNGRLALALRGFGDSGNVQTRPVWDANGPVPTCATLMGLSSLQ